MAIAHTDLNAALARAKDRAGAPDSADDFLAELLDLSAGTVEGVTHYRPYYVAARWIEQNRGDQTLAEAKGGTRFTNLKTPIASLMALQSAYDTAKGLAIPAGFEATSDQTSTPTPTPQRYTTRSLPTTISP